MEVWALANQKGGTGKTTTAIHLSAALAARGKRVLLIDLDPQAHATLGVGIAVDANSECAGEPGTDRSIADAFLDGRPLIELVRSTSSGFHLIPATARLAEFEEVAERSLQPEGILESALRGLEKRYDWVLVDCPPRADGVITTNAVRAATTTLLVVETGAFAMQGALRAREIFERHAREHLSTSSPNARPTNLRIVATMFERGDRIASEFLIALQARFGEIMLDSVIRRDSVLRAAVAYGVPAAELDPESNAVADFDALASEILSLTSRAPTVTREPATTFTRA